MASAASLMAWSRPSSRMLSRNMRVSCAILAIRSSASPPLPWVIAFAGVGIIISRYSSGQLFEDLVQLLFEDGGGEGLDDIAAGPRLGGGNDVLFLGLGRDHQHRKLGQAGLRADDLERGQPIYIGHVPVRDHKIEVVVAQLLQPHRAVFGLVHILDAK